MSNTSVNQDTKSGPVSAFLRNNFKHFNAATVIDAATAYNEQLAKGNKIVITLAGAMSTAELGRTLAEMIRQDKVHAIVCTGANLEEDLFNLVAHNEYKRIPNYRNLNEVDEKELEANGFNRVTDTCIPEGSAIDKIESALFPLWSKVMKKEKEGWFPHEFMYELIRRKEILRETQGLIENSWVIAAYEKNLPIIVPGWEDSTLGNIFASYCFDEILESWVVLGGIEYMMYFMEWIHKITIEEQKEIGFFQIGGGIAGDFPICAVPLFKQDLNMPEVPFWSYFCQITDATESYGGYSGAPAQEKISWGKLDVGSPKFVINSDATIVAPLMFAIILNQ